MEGHIGCRGACPGQSPVKEHPDHVLLPKQGEIIERGEIDMVVFACEISAPTKTEAHLCDGSEAVIAVPSGDVRTRIECSGRRIFLVADRGIAGKEQVGCKIPFEAETHREKAGAVETNPRAEAPGGGLVCGSDWAAWRRDTGEPCRFVQGDFHPLADQCASDACIGGYGYVSPLIKRAARGDIQEVKAVLPLGCDAGSSQGLAVRCPLNKPVVDYKDGSAGRGGRRSYPRSGNPGRRRCAARRFAASQPCIFGINDPFVAGYCAKAYLEAGLESERLENRCGIWGQVEVAAVQDAVRRQ